MSARLLCVFALFAHAAFAAPTLEGAPGYSTDRLGVGVSDFGSQWAVKAEVQGPRSDLLGALAFYDARPNAVRDNPVAGANGLGSFTIRLSDGPAPRFASGRSVRFQNWGWTESASDGDLGASVQVFTLSRDVFAVVLEVTGGALNFEARVDGKTASQGSGTVEAGATPTLTIDNAEGRPFGLAFWTDASSSMFSSFNGVTYGAIWKGAVSGRVAFVLAFHSDVSQSAPLLQQALAGAGAVETWRSSVEADWAGYLAGYSQSHETRPERLALDERARAVLRMNEVRGADDAPGPAGYPAKTHYNHFWLWDSAFQALGAAERSTADAAAYLAPSFRGQIRSAADPDVGMIPNHVDEAGLAPPVGFPGAVDVYSQAPVFGFVLRDLKERGAAVDDYVTASADYLDWWGRRRDRDGDGLSEVNGGWEGGQDNSPLFTEPWGDSPLSRLPVSENDARPQLNSVDINAWLYLYELELARLSGAEGAQWRQRALDRLFRMEDAEDGFWNEERGGYYNFTRVGEERARSFYTARTYTLFSPLVVGATRDTARVRRLMAQLTDPKQFWGPHGVSSVAFDDPSFKADDYWRGPVWINVNYFMLTALYRYGYEAKAEELREKILSLIVERDLWEYFDAQNGSGLNVYGFGWTAALYMEIARHRYEAEAFATSEGGPAAAREGYLRRLFRLSDGALLFELSTEGTFEVPRVRIESDSQIFASEPMTISFTDPAQAVGERTVRVSFPEFSSATVVVERADGTSERKTQSSDSAQSPLSVELASSSVLRIERFTFRRASGCGCSQGSEAAVGLMGLLVLGALLARRRCLS